MWPQVADLSARARDGERQRQELEAAVRNAEGAAKQARAERDAEVAQVRRPYGNLVNVKVGACVSCAVGSCAVSVFVHGPAG